MRLRAFPRLIAAEFLKLRRSLVLLLCAAAPALVALLSFLMFMRWEKPQLWLHFAMGGSALWAYFMLPMTITALTVLVAQLEHGPRAWNHILALPVPRWQIFVAKALVVLTLGALMSIALVLLIPAAGLLGEWMKGGDQLLGAIPWEATVSIVGKMFLGSMLLTMLQLWAALRFRSFVPPLVLGIGGTFVAVAATSAKEGPFFPWLIPTNVLASDPARAAVAIDVGLYGGLLLLVAMVIHMSRAEVR